MSAILRITSCLLLLGGTTVFGQEPSPSKEAPPKPPLMVSAPSSSQWTITYTSNVPDKKKPTAEELQIRKMRQQYSPLVLSKRVLKASGQMVIYTNYEVGLKSEAWVVGRYLYTLPMREGQGVQVDIRNSGDFPEISWVKAANFRGTVKLKKRQLHLYQVDETDSHQAASPTTRPQHEEPASVSGNATARRAYIDPETRLPVVVEKDNSVLTYEFSEPPAIFPIMDERISQQPKPAQE